MLLLRLSSIWDNLEEAAHLWGPECGVPMSHIEFKKWIFRMSLSLRNGY